MAQGMWLTVMRFDVITLFPELVQQLAQDGVVGRALDQQYSMQLWNPRDFTTDKHRTVDDRPYGGGPGMVMKPEPLAAVLDAAKAENPQAMRVYLSPQGEPLTQPLVQELAELPGLILLAGRYEGVDERVLTTRIDREISIGDFVVSGGELPAMLLMDAVVRLLPGVLGDVLSAQQDSFSEASEGLLDCPHYTRPEEFEGLPVPEVLLSGNHQAIADWRWQQMREQTQRRRPDLIKSSL